MKRILLFIVVAAALSACASSGKPRKKIFNSDLCGDVTGYTVAYFVYGEGKMVIVPLSKVKTGSVFIIGLKPLDGYEDADVTVTQSSGTPDWIDPDPDTNQYQNLPKKGFFTKSAWLEVGCPKDDAVGTIYKYAIEVEKDGVKNILDPRADVVW